MADPVAYDVGYSFANFQSNSPASPLPGQKVDAEFASVAHATEDLVRALHDVRRSDGMLQNGCVTLDSLSAGLLGGLGNIDETAAAAIDDAIALVHADLEADLAAGLATKADIVHTHNAADIAISGLPGITGATLQDILLGLRALCPQPGDFKLSMNPLVPAGGWVACNDGTIGNEVSGATSRHHEDCLALYTVIWNNVPNSIAPVSGDPNRGPTAAIDFSNSRTIALTKVLGRVLGIAGAGQGLTARGLGAILGTETHQLLVAELPAHDHSVSGTPGRTGKVDLDHTHTYTNPVTGVGGQAADGASGTTIKQPTVNGGTSGLASIGTSMNHNHALATVGTGQAHPNMQPTAFTMHAFLKL